MMSMYKMKMCTHARTHPMYKLASTTRGRRWLHAAVTSFPCITINELAGKGRAVVALKDLGAGTTLHECVPMAHVLKTVDVDRCLECLAPLARSKHGRHCSITCVNAYTARGGAMLDRVDLSGLRALHEQQGRKFPLLIASMLASLLAEIKASGRLPDSWAPLELCFAELHDEAAAQTATEHAQLIESFCAAGLSNRATLELLLPLARYRRLLGAAQLNAFELTLTQGAQVAALLPGLASCFNHSCAPNVLMACGATSRVAFVAGEPIAAGDELCISYVDLEQSRAERQELLLHKYGFVCSCARCTSEVMLEDSSRDRSL